MGYNRAGTRRRARLKRAKRHEEHLRRKATNPGQANGGTGLLSKVKGAAQAAAEAVGGAIGSVVDKVRGRE